MKAQGPSCHGSVLFSPRVLREKEVGKREKWAVYYLVLLPQFDKTKTKNEGNWCISMLKGENVFSFLSMFTDYVFICVIIYV